MNTVVFERRKNGIFRSDHRILPGKLLGASSEPKPIEGTPWTLLRETYTDGEVPHMTSDRLRLSNPQRGTDVIAIDVALGRFRFRFFSLLAPAIRYEGARIHLYDGEEMVAEHRNAWRDRDFDAGILARVETQLIGPAADAAAILLFHLVERPLLAISGREPESEPPMGF